MVTAVVEAVAERERERLRCSRCAASRWSGGSGDLDFRHLHPTRSAPPGPLGCGPGGRLRRSTLGLDASARHHVVAGVHRQGQRAPSWRAHDLGRAYDPAPAGEARHIRVAPADAVGEGGHPETDAAAEAPPALPSFPLHALRAVTTNTHRRSFGLAFLFFFLLFFLLAWCNVVHLFLFVCTYRTERVVTCWGLQHDLLF